MTHSETADDDKITVTFELPPREQVKASRSVTHRLWGTWLGYGLFGLMSLSVLVVTAWRTAQGQALQPLSTFLAAVVPLLGVLAIYLTPSLTVWRWRREMPIHQGPHTWTLSPTGLEIASPQTTTALEWSLVKVLRETPEFWLFYVTKRMAYVLPKRVLTPAAAFSLRTSLRAWLGARCRLKG